MNNKIINVIKCILYLFGALMVALPVQAVSFDCAKARTKVEKLICGDAELSRLDEDLSKTYQQTLERSDDKQKLTDEQRQWLKRRNVCTDAVCVKRAYEGRLKELSSKGSHDPVNNKDDKTANTHPYILVMSKDNELCKSMLNLYNTDMNTHGRIDYDAHEIFSRIGWEDVDILEPDPYATPQRAVFDINNDGKNELVISQTWTMNNALEESLYIFPSDNDVLSKLKPGKGGLAPLFDDKNMLFSYKNILYYLKDLPNVFQKKILSYKLSHLPKYLKKVRIQDLNRDLGKAYVGGTFVLQPFIFHGITYISITDRNPEWIIVGKYKQAEEVQDICYFYDQSHRFIHF